MHPNQCEHCQRPIVIPTFRTVETPIGTIATPARVCGACLIREYRADLIRAAARDWADEHRPAALAYHLKGDAPQ